jgi:hypothetical protein
LPGPDGVAVVEGGVGPGLDADVDGAGNRTVVPFRRRAG